MTSGLETDEDGFQRGLLLVVVWVGIAQSQFSAHHIYFLAHLRRAVYMECTLGEMSGEGKTCLCNHIGVAKVLFSYLNLNFKHSVGRQSGKTIQKSSFGGHCSCAPCRYVPITLPRIFTPMGSASCILYTNFEVL